MVPTAFGADGLFGGGERYPLELTRALARRVEARLVTFGPRAADVAGDPHITVLRTAVRLKGHPVHPLGRGLLRALRGADLIHAHHMRAAPTRLAALAAAVSDVPIVVTDHGLGRGGWLGALPKLFDAFLAVSNYSAATLGAPPAKTTIVYGGADTDMFRPTGAERRGALFVGRLTPHKGVDRLIEALPDGVPLTIAGSAGHDRGPESDYPRLLRRLAEGKEVTFLERLDDERLADLYRTARVLVLPSVNVTRYGKPVAIPELLGLSALEAMASGTPVICSRVGGLPEVVVDGVTGCVVEPGNGAELRDRIEQLCNDQRLARSMGDNARSLVVERFTWGTCAERCLTAYRSIGAL